MLEVGYKKQKADYDICLLMGKDPYSDFCVTRKLGEAMSEQTHTREVLKLSGSFFKSIGNLI